MKEITKKEFDDAYNKHLPSKWIKFAYKYFSKETEKKDLVINNLVVTLLATLFAFGFFGTVFNVSGRLVLFATISYTIILSTLVLYLLSAVFLNNNRIRKIRKVLGLNKQEYNDYVDKFYP